MVSLGRREEGAPLSRAPLECVLTSDSGRGFARGLGLTSNLGGCLTIRFGGGLTSNLGGGLAIVWQVMWAVV